MTTELGQGTAIAWLIGYAMFVTLGGWIFVLAVRIRGRVPQPEAILWEYFALAGSTGLLSGLLGLIWLLDGGDSPALSGVVDAVLLSFLLLCALSMREAYFNTVLSNAESDRLAEYPLRRILEIGFVVSVIVVGISAVTAGFTGVHAVLDAIAVIAAVSAVLIVSYGLYFNRERTRLPATRGTVIDTLLRQLVPVLAFAGGALSIPLLLERAAEPSVAGTVAAILVVMAATALVSVTIKFRQHLSVQR